MATEQRFPLFYRVIFTFVDPFISLITGYLILFRRDETLAKLSPLFVPRAQAYDPLLWQLAGGYWITSIMQGWLLRRSKDLAIWKIANFAVLVMDLLILGSIWEMRGPPHNLAQGMSSGDWSHVFGAGIFALFRVAFILEIGFTKAAFGRKS